MNKSGRRWIAIVIALLVAQAVGIAILIVQATMDPSHHVVEDYYDKALAWDQHMAQERLNRELGWRVGLTLAPVVGEPSMRVQAQVLDRAGAPLAAARVAVEAFHNARASRVLRASLAEQGQGTYVASLPMRRAGIWELNFVVEHGGRRFTHRAGHELFRTQGAAR